MSGWADVGVVSMLNTRQHKGLVVGKSRPQTTAITQRFANYRPIRNQLMGRLRGNFMRGDRVC